MPRGQALMKRTVKMTDEMQPVFGPGKVIKVSDLNKKLWAYIKKHKLMTGEGPLMKRSITVTDDMKPVFGPKKAVKIGEMMKLLWVYIRRTSCSSPFETRPRARAVTNPRGPGAFSAAKPE